MIVFYRSDIFTFGLEGGHVRRRCSYFEGFFIYFLPDKANLIVQGNAVIKVL